MTFIRNSYVIPQSLTFRDKAVEAARGRARSNVSTMNLTQSYEAQRDLLTGQRYKRGNSGVAERSELTAAALGTTPYAYDYDNIGNRKTAQENAEEITYTANALNQYTQIDTDGNKFTPEYDADGNQIRIKTSTGIWSAEYNAQNRAIRYTRENADGTRSVVTADYDYMGRQAWKKVESITPNPETGEETTTVLLHHRYIYRGYLQIATCDLTRSNHPCLWLITWDPTQPVATRPLAIQKDSTWYCYGWDLTKNICEIYSTGGYIRTVYTYTPYGEVTASGNVTQSPRGLGGGLDKPKGFAPQGRGRNGVRPSQPIQWSSEFNDSDIGLIYYNYRYYNPTDGRWTRRDPIGTNGGNNLYWYCGNSVISRVDGLGKNYLMDREYVGSKTKATTYVSYSEAITMCAGYTDSKCCDRNNFIQDPYIKKARTICKNFMTLYNTNEGVPQNVTCVAECLIDEEYRLASTTSCRERNRARLGAHVVCYAMCMFIPTKGFPEGGVEVGWEMLLPSFF